MLLMLTQFFFLFLCLCTISGCATPRSQAYREFYSHLDYPQPIEQSTYETDHFLIINVNARHLDYTNNRSFLNTIAKHPSDGSKNRDVGHAWIYVQGIVDGELVSIEGGHSGELGILQPKYFDGIMNYLDYGYPSLPCKEAFTPRYEPNPIKYLWETQHDGFFESGSGRHNPTYAVKVPITVEQFVRIYDYINSYHFENYAITSTQCSSFAAHIATLAGLDLECEVTMEIEPSIHYRGQQVRLWTDPSYSLLTISSPDILERSLMECVSQKKAQRISPK